MAEMQGPTLPRAENHHQPPKGDLLPPPHPLGAGSRPGAPLSPADPRNPVPAHRGSKYQQSTGQDGEQAQQTDPKIHMQASPRKGA